MASFLIYFQSLNSRPVLLTDTSTSSTEAADASNASNMSSSSSDPLSISDVANDLQHRFGQYVNPVEWAREIGPHITLQNAANVGRFLVILVMAVVSGAAALLPKLWALLNRYVRMLGFTVRMVQIILKL